MATIKENASRRRKLASEMWATFAAQARQGSGEREPKPAIYVIAKFTDTAVAKYVAQFGNDEAASEKATQDLLTRQNTPSPLHNGWKPGKQITNIYYEVPVNKSVEATDPYQCVLVKRFTDSAAHLDWLEKLDSLNPNFFVGKAVEVVSIMQYEYVDTDAIVE